MTPHQYIEVGMASNKGWFYKPDAYAMVDIDTIQQELGVSGSLVEIGVYQGKSLTLLSLLAHEHEKVIGLDLFTLGQSDMGASVGAVAMAGGKASVRVFNSQLDNVDALDLGSIRMLHIDGDHSFDGVSSDLTRFAPYVQRGGVIVMDDYHQRDDPGVAIAVNRWCMRTDWVMFMSSFNKVFLCHRSMAHIYVSHRIELPRGETMRVDHIEGFPLLTLDTKKPMTINDCKITAMR